MTTILLLLLLIILIIITIIIIAENSCVFVFFKTGRPLRGNRLHREISSLLNFNPQTAL